MASAPIASTPAGSAPAASLERITQGTDQQTENDKVALERLQEAMTLSVIRRRHGRLDSLVAQDQSQYFHLENGTELKSLKELAECLPRMDDELFRRHVGATYNHFADWVRGVFHDDEWADALAQAKTKDAMLQALNATA